MNILRHWFKRNGTRHAALWNQSQRSTSHYREPKEKGTGIELIIYAVSKRMLPTLHRKLNIEGSMFD